MKYTTYPSITQFEQHVELKDFRKPTKKEYIRYVRKLAEHFQCDPATLTENQLREYFLFLRQHKHYKSAPMKAAKYALLSFYRIASRSADGPFSRNCASPNQKSCPSFWAAPKSRLCWARCVNRASARAATDVPLWSARGRSGRHPSPGHSRAQNPAALAHSQRQRRQGPLRTHRPA